MICGQRKKTGSLDYKGYHRSEKIAKFYISPCGYAKAGKILTDLRKSTEILERDHKIGAEDENFLHLKRHYRKLVNHHCKITYREGKTKIYVVRF